MKIRLLIIAALLCTANSFAQKNLFDVTDVDQDGWLWFDSMEKIDKYIGNSKLIQLGKAAWGDGVASFADAETPGVGSDSILASPTARIGSIVLAPAKMVTFSTDGGTITFKMPSCQSLNMFFSCERTMQVVVRKSENAIDWTNVVLKSQGFGSKPFSKKGQKDWEISKDGKEPLNTISTPIYIRIISMTGGTDPNANLYIHGIKAITKEPSGIAEMGDNSLTFSIEGKELILSQEAIVKLYNTTGTAISEQTGKNISLQGLANGIYIVRAVTAEGVKTAKFTIR